MNKKRERNFSTMKTMSTNLTTQNLNNYLRTYLPKHIPPNYLYKQTQTVTPT